MMNRLMQLFDLHGLKVRILIMSFGANLLLSYFILTGTADRINQTGDGAVSGDVILMLSLYFASGLIGFGAALLAKDDRGPSYGVLGAIGSFIVVILITYQTGLLALIVAFTALLGGYNGGKLGEGLLAKNRD